MRSTTRLAMMTPVKPGLIRQELDAASPCQEQEFVKCLLCEGDQGDLYIRVPGAFPIVRCPNDGLLYMNPRPKAQATRKFHTRFVRENNLNMFDVRRRKVLQREASIIKSLKAGGRLLDVGCATGTFFETFIGSDWQLYGVDTSPIGVQTARERYGAEISCGTLHEACYPAKFFEVVTVLDTIYYSPDPKADLLEIHRILKDDGLLAVEIPGLWYRLLRDKGLLCWLLDRLWVRGFRGMQFYYFSPVTIRLLLESTGFRVLRMMPEQASLGRRGVAELLNEAHFQLAKLLFRTTASRFSIAGKEFYLARKKSLARELPPAAET